MVNRRYCIHFCVGFEEGKSFKISQLQRFDQIGFTCRSVARCPFVQLDFRFSRHFSKYYKNYDANVKYNMHPNHSRTNAPCRTLVIVVHICDWFVSYDRLRDLTFDIVVDLKVSILGLLLGLF